MNNSNQQHNPSEVTEQLAELPVVQLAVNNESSHTAESLHELLQAQRQANRHAQPDYRQRKKELRLLQHAIQRSADDVVAALQADFGQRSKHETLATEVLASLTDLRFAEKHLRRWMKAKRFPVTARFSLAKAQVLRQPLGCVGIMSAWNFPFYLAISPLVSAIAAGNSVILKPSERAPATSALLAKLLAEVFPTERVAVVQGDAELAATFSALPLDHLLFTGSSDKGQLVLAAAAKNLTPVTLELGGKSPALIDDYDLKISAMRILRGKLLNAGQNCVAPDYVLVQELRLNELVTILRKQYKRMVPKLDPQSTQLIDAKQVQRMAAFMADAEAKGARLLSLSADGGSGAESVIASPDMAPILVLNPTEDMRIMQEEIFGPLLPLKTYRELSDALTYINDRPNPLALYFFSNQSSQVEKILANSLSGSVTINDCLFHAAQPALPFGGVGDSGMGNAQGEYGFLTFSKEKAVLKQRRHSPMDYWRPPHGWLMHKLLRLLIGRGKRKH